MTEYVEVPRLLASCKALVAAMRRYEVEVEGDAPQHHIDMMAEAEAAIIAATPEAQVAPQGGGEVLEMLRECYEWLFESKADGPRVSEGAIERGYYTPEFRDLHCRLKATIESTQPAGTLSGDVEQVARELLAAEYERHDLHEHARCIRTKEFGTQRDDERALRAIVAALSAKEIANGG